MKSKKAISLIVLVITIIVMIVLAGAIILTLNNSGVLTKAEEAVEKTNLAQVKQFVQMKWAEAYADGARTKAEFESAMEESLKGMDLTAYNIGIAETGVTVELKNTSTGEETFEMITFSVEGKEYTVKAGTTWYDFIWYGQGEWLQINTNLDTKDGNVLNAAGLPLIIEATNEYVEYDNEIIATNYVVDIGSVQYPTVGNHITNKLNGGKVTSEDYDPATILQYYTYTVAEGAVITSIEILGATLSDENGWVATPDCEVGFDKAGTVIDKGTNTLYFKIDRFGGTDDEIPGTVKFNFSDGTSEEDTFVYGFYSDDESPDPFS